MHLSAKIDGVAAYSWRLLIRQGVRVAPLDEDDPLDGDLLPSGCGMENGERYAQRGVELHPGSPGGEVPSRPCGRGRRRC